MAAAFLPSSRQPQFASKVSEAIEAGEKFIEVFYDTVDKRRQVARCVMSFHFGAHQETSHFTQKIMNLHSGYVGSVF